MRRTTKTEERGFVLLGLGVLRELIIAPLLPSGFTQFIRPILTLEEFPEYFQVQRQI